MSNLLDHFLVRATVAGVELATPRMRRIRLVGGPVRGLAWTPGQHVRVRVEGLSLRTYSVWSRGDDHVDLGVLDHPGDGPGARWARSVHSGQRVAFTRPQGRLVLRDDAPYHLFVGDATTCPAFGAMLAGVTAPAFAVISVDGPDDRVPLPHCDVRWVHTGGVEAALRALDLPAGPGVAYVAGEARTCQAVRRHLVTDRGWPRTAVVTKPFWAPGRRGLD